MSENKETARLFEEKNCPEKQENEAIGGFILSIVRKFLSGYNSPIFICLAVVMGIGAILATPREEEPQIIVPLADIYVYYPGAKAQEVEYLVATPLEKLLWQIDGVEYVYSMSRREMAIVTVRFYVGQDRERSLLKLYNKLYSHIDQITPGITGWVIKPVEIDDVPIVNVALYSKKCDDYALRRVGEEMLRRLEALSDNSKTSIIGGLPREVRIEIEPSKLAGMGLSPLEIYQAMIRQNVSITAGQFERNNQIHEVYSGPFLHTIEQVKELVVGVYKGHPVRLQDISQILDQPAERSSYVRIGFGQANPNEMKQYPQSVSCVNLSIAKKKGTNAVTVADEAIALVKKLKGSVIPQEIDVLITRNYGQTANQKVNDLLLSLVFAIVTVVALLMMTMGWREALIVAISVPISFALSLFVNLIAGYTINRVTLFALILSLGLVVDDPITNVDNVQRHILTGKRKNPILETLFAVQEVLPPVIMSTLTIIVCFLPMFFITGMMGPYMMPMAINVPLTVTFSTVCALTFVPWLSYQFLKRRHGENRITLQSNIGVSSIPETFAIRIYRGMMKPFLQSKKLAIVFLIGIGVLFLFSCSLAVLGYVPLKMLPYDNKNEVQIIVDAKDGTTLEKTDSAVQALELYLQQIPEVTNFTSYIGTSSPIDFNGLVRHYYLRQGPSYADIRVNILDKEERQQQSHILLLRLRNDLEKIARAYSVHIKLVEMPPGPPVVATLVAEIYGDFDKNYSELIAQAKIVRDRMSQEEGVVDVDWMVEDAYQQWEFQIDKTKASLSGIDTQIVTQTLRLLLNGMFAGNVHLENERNPLMIRLILPRIQRSSLEQLATVQVKGQSGQLVALSEIGQFIQHTTEPVIYHKNLIPLVYVTGEMAGRAPAEAVFSLQSYFKKNPLPKGIHINWAGEGEWLITIQVFRDLGIAFAVALIAVYFLIVIETNSLLMPIIIMMAIPLTAIGIMPGFWLLNLIGSQNVGGFTEPIFFTATGMIGMIALGGIVVRNSIVLIEFIQSSQQEGMSLQDAILLSGGVRFRPIMLTAGTTVLGAWPITLDPIFSGLAWALIFGLFASTLFSLVIVPIIYYFVYGKKTA